MRYTSYINLYIKYTHYQMHIGERERERERVSKFVQDLQRALLCRDERYRYTHIIS